MIDWQGLLKFSLQYSDGTKQSEFKEMSVEDKKWLEEAMKQFCCSEIQRIKIILQKLSEKEQQSSEEYRLSLLEELQQILDSLDQGSTLYKMGGHIILLKIIFFSKFQSNKIVALQIFASINQNDSYVQTQSINSGALELVETILKTQSISLRENILSAISSMIRGQNLEAKRIFIRLNGLQLLKTLYTTKNMTSKRLQHKIFVLLRDLLFYDQNLHYTYNDLSSFSNTANVMLQKEELKDKKQEQKNSLTFDQNKLVENNELEENKKYKGCINDWLSKQQNSEIKKYYFAWLKEQEKLEKD